MNYRKKGLKALGVSMLAVLGLMALAASGAQGSGTLLVLNPAKTALLAGFGNFPLTGVGLNMLANKILTLGLNMEVFCHTTIMSGSLSETGTGTFTIKLENCLAQGVSGGALSGAVCTIPNITHQAKALLILHGLVNGQPVKLTLDGTGGAEHKLPKVGDTYILFTPLDLLTFAKITNPTECALPETSNFKGCFVAKVDNLNYASSHDITTIGMLELFGCKLSYGANESHLDFEARISSVSGELWAVH